MKVDEKAFEVACETLGRPDHAGDRLMIRAAITTYLSARSAEPVAEFKLVKRPVAFRVKAPEETGWSWLYYRDEQKAAESADNLGVDYEGLYVRDGTPLIAAPTPSPDPEQPETRETGE